MASQIIRTWTAPVGWVPKHPMDKPRFGPAVPTLRDVGLDRLMGRTVAGTQRYVGSYGMGGPGFLGIQLAGNRAERRPEWLVLRLWAAADKCVLKGRPASTDAGTALRPLDVERWVHEVVGTVLVRADVWAKSCELMFREERDQRRAYRLSVPAHASQRSACEGTGRSPVLAPGDSLWDAWVVSPTENLYV